ncbi:MAG: CDF family Co(II)/Ni(II) efflux transporter DmeF [Pirellulaceae bacterium]|nr:CDF family Co(II)/Ni(II) efflux transporter DmeF [Pirellulaceae bacterium]
MDVADRRNSSNHDHSFGQDRPKPGEARTRWVVGLTAATMMLEIVAGIVYGSMALLADGLHMASHATALAIAMWAYLYARWHAHDERFSFGTGKVNALAGFTGAVLLAGFAVLMMWQSVVRLVAPIAIAFDQALIVAVIGLVVNGLSVAILGQSGPSDNSDGAPEADDAHHHPELSQRETLVHDHDHDHPHAHDHNLRSAYLHVLADTLTSFLAIGALLAGKFYGLAWLDPVMGVVGSLLVGRWSLGLMRTTAHVLLDRQGPPGLCDQIRAAVQAPGDATVTDLHLWWVAPGSYSLIVAVAARQPQSPDSYRRRLPSNVRLVHVTIEVNPMRD